MHFYGLIIGSGQYTLDELHARTRKYIQDSVDAFSVYLEFYLFCSKTYQILAVATVKWIERERENRNDTRKREEVFASAHVILCYIVYHLSAWQMSFQITKYPRARRE